MKDKSVLIVGAGAIGGTIAATLSRAGMDVEVVCKYPEYRDICTDKGLEVTTPTGKFTQRVQSVTTLEEVRGARDYIILATKSNDLDSVGKKIQTIFGKDSLIIGIQNGMDDYSFIKSEERERLVHCIVGWGATMEEFGKLSMTSDGEFVIGNSTKGGAAYLDDVAHLLEMIAPVRISENITGDRYSKLIINSCITALGAVTGLYLGDMLRKKKARLLFIEIIREAMELAHIMRIKVEPFAGKLNYYEFIQGEGWRSNAKRHTTIRVIGRKFKKLKSSSLQSLEKGKSTEIDWLNGYIAENGRELGVPVPVNRELTKMVHEIEDGNRKIGSSNLDNEAFTKYYI